MALAASLNLYLLGKITGISGIIFKCLTLTDCYYNFSFLLGMIFISSFLRCFIYPNMKQTTVDSPTFLESSGQFVGDLSLPGFIIAGFLVGFGAKMANGCTSGHGVCGLPRLSKRSIVAIALFILFGLTTATLKYYLQFLRPSSYAFNGVPRARMSPLSSIRRRTHREKISVRLWRLLPMVSVAN